jgi:hypothetical protein
MSKTSSIKPLLGPPNKFLNVFGYLFENQYKLEHLKFANVFWQIVTLKQVENNSTSSLRLSLKENK